MPNIVKKVELILVDCVSNKNKHYKALYYDDGTAESFFGRVGGGEQSCQYPTHRALDKKLAGKYKKGYVELKTVKSGDAPTAKNVAKEELARIALAQIKRSSSELDKLIERLVQYNIHNITQSTALTFSEDTGLFSTPLGIVTPDGIKSARETLNEIAEYIKNRDFCEKFVKYVNQYLMLVPKNLGMRRFDAKELFPDLEEVQKQNDILDSLESSYAALSKQPQKQEVEKVFEVELDILKDANEVARITKWFKDTNLPVHGYSNKKIVNIYKVNVSSVGKAFEEKGRKLGNIIEVFHSTSGQNLLSVLKCGLKVKPPSTVYTVGSLFNSGLYGSLTASKSLQYTFSRFGGSSTDTGWTFVCDFAMGNTDYIKTYGGSRAPGKDSIWALPENTGLRFDEEIVPHEWQCNLKYLLEVK